MTMFLLDRVPKAIWLHGLVGLALVASLVDCAASPMLTQDEATAKVLEYGFKLAAKAEPAKSQDDPAVWESVAASPSWDIWAVKDGIAYRVTVDGSTGDLVRAAPAVEDD